MESGQFKSGSVTIIGAPNAGKSTFLNAILGEKIAIATPKPQTTRDNIVGVKHLEGAQIVFVDTPGIHKARGKLNKAMVQNAMDAMDQVDLILFMVDAFRQGRRDDASILFRDGSILAALEKQDVPVILVLNKLDRLKKAHILPVIDSWKEAYPFEAIVPISARSGTGIEELTHAIVSRLPEGPALYPDDMVTDRSVRFLTSEIIREKLFMQLREEMPYAIVVEIEKWDEDSERAEIHAAIHVERDSQKRIVVGTRGEGVKSIGIAARKEIEELLQKKVRLNLFVHVEAKWSESSRALERFGYLDRDRRK